MGRFPSKSELEGYLLATEETGRIDDFEALVTIAQLLAEAWVEARHPERAKSVLARIVALVERTPELGRSAATEVRVRFGKAFGLSGSDDLAEPILCQAAHEIESTVGANDPSMANVLSIIGFMHKKKSRYREATAAFRHALAILEGAVDNNDRRIATAALDLGDCLHEGRVSLGSDVNEIESHYRRAVSIILASTGERDPELFGALHRHAGLLRTESRHDEALQLTQRADALSRS